MPPRRRPSSYRQRPDRRWLVQDVRVLRGPQPDDRRRRPGGPGQQLRLASPGHQAGLINLNLIIDEEVFFSVFGKQNTAFNNAASPLYEQLLCFNQLQPPVGSFQGGSACGRHARIAAAHWLDPHPARGDGNHRQRLAGRCIPDEQHGCRSPGSRLEHNRKLHEDVVRPVPDAAARWLRVHLRLRERFHRAEPAGAPPTTNPNTPTPPFRIPAERPFPLAVVSGYQLHGDAARRASSVHVHGPLAANLQRRRNYAGDPG